MGKSWVLDETYITVKGQWKYLYRAVDKEGNSLDYLLTAKREREAAQHFFSRAIRSKAEAVKITIGMSGANAAGIQAHGDDQGSNIEIRQNKYLKKIIEQDHRPIKLLRRGTWGFKGFGTAKIAIGGFESMSIFGKRQIEAEGYTSTEIIYSIAA